MNVYRVEKPTDKGALTYAYVTAESDDEALRLCDINNPDHPPLFMIVARVAHPQSEIITPERAYALRVTHWDNPAPRSKPSPNAVSYVDREIYDPRCNDTFDLKVVRQKVLGTLNLYSAVIEDVDGDVLNLDLYIEDIRALAAEYDEFAVLLERGNRSMGMDISIMIMSTDGGYRLKSILKPDGSWRDIRAAYKKVAPQSQTVKPFPPIHRKAWENR